MSKTISECFFALIVAVALGAAAASEAHAQNYGSGDFNVNGIRQANRVNTGVVVDVVRSQLYVEPNAAQLVQLAVAEQAGLAHHLIDKGGLPMIDVRDDGNIAEVISLHEWSFFS